MSSICTLLSADAHSVPSAIATRRGRSIRKVACTQRTGDDVGHTLVRTPFHLASAHLDRAFSAGCPDLRCFNRCTVAARTLARLLGAATRLERLQLSCRIAYSLRTRDPPRAAGLSPKKFDEAASRGRTRQRVRPHVPGEDGGPGLISESLTYEKEEKTATHRSRDGDRLQRGTVRGDRLAAVSETIGMGRASYSSTR